MKYCIKCGKGMDGKDVYCPYCGAKAPDLSERIKEINEKAIALQHANYIREHTSLPERKFHYFSLPGLLSLSTILFSVFIIIKSIFMALVTSYLPKGALDFGGSPSMLFAECFIGYYTSVIFESVIFAILAGIRYYHHKDEKVALYMAIANSVNALLTYSMHNLYKLMKIIFEKQDLSVLIFDYSKLFSCSTYKHIFICILVISFILIQFSIHLIAVNQKKGLGYRY